MLVLASHDALTMSSPLDVLIVSVSLAGSERVIVTSRLGWPATPSPRCPTADMSVRADGAVDGDRVDGGVAGGR